MTWQPADAARYDAVASDTVPYDAVPYDATVQPDAAAPTPPAPTGVAASGDIPLWAIALGWELRRGRQVILHGEVNDRYWLWDEPAPFRLVVAEYLVATGARVVGWWDPVDGLTFPVEGHAEAFTRLRLALATGEDEHVRRPPGPADEPEPAGPGGAVFDERAVEGAAGGDGTRRGARRAAVREATHDALAPDRQAVVPPGLVEVISLVRRVAASRLEATAFVFQDIDAVLSPADPDTPRTYLQLRAAMADAVVPDGARGEPPVRRNAVLAVTGDLSRIPDWFHTEDPRVTALQVRRPDQAERRLWMRMLRGQFRDLDPDRDVEPLVGATDGLAAWELDALARTSVIRGVPAAKPARLLDALRLNVRSNPWEKLDRATVAASDRILGAQVLGQQAAVDAVADALMAAYTGVDFGTSGLSRPRGVFFFVGPTGVGKTELAKSVSRLLFGDDASLARFDMSEYSQPQTAERLAGAPPGYVGFEQGGELTRRVQERPFSVLLFDEIEKADPSLMDKFLQILEDGRLTDGRGRTAYFSQTLIIFTSNIGSKTVAELAPDSPDGPSYDLLREHFTGAVEEHFQGIGRPEIFGRLRGGVVVFDMLRPHHVAGIADRLLGQLAESVLERQRVELVPDRESVQAWIQERMRRPNNAKYGGRQIRTELEVLRRAVVRHLVEHPAEPGARLGAGVDPGGTPWVADLGRAGS
jgi:ATP-dependent Clp protease ATP-binding subunit ClpB